jgi:hypothetical protein
VSPSARMQTSWSMQGSESASVANSKLSQKFLWNCERPRPVTTILKKNKFDELQWLK